MILDVKQVDGSIFTAIAPHSPTSDYEDFTLKLRETAKHPSDVVFEVPVLPKKTDCLDMTLPNPVPTVTTSSQTQSRGRGRGLGISPKSKVGKKLKEPQSVATTEGLRPYLFVWVTTNEDEEPILLLLRRLDIYWVAYKDLENCWWEFKRSGEPSFIGAKAFGFDENYTQMGSLSIDIGTHQMINAFHVLARPKLADMEARKKAVKTFTLTVCESARSKILFKMFHTALRDNRHVKVTQELELLIKNWKKMSHIIIRSKQQKEDTLLSEVMSEKDKELRKVLEKEGMTKIGESKLFYGLFRALSEDEDLHSSSAGSSSSSSKV